jgi:hypothetical protein
MLEALAPFTVRRNNLDDSLWNVKVCEINCLLLFPGLAVFVVLPLGLLRNVDSLSSVCAATIGFYLCLVLKVSISSAYKFYFFGLLYDSSINKIGLWLLTANNYGFS